MNIDLALEYDWSPVTCTDGAPYRYPRPVRDVRSSFHAPAVYRWRFMNGEVLAALFIGECADLLKELNAGVNPGAGQKSGGRIKAALGERMLLGQAGVVDVLTVRACSLGGTAVADPLKDQHLRRAIESLLIHEASKEDVELLNQETSARDLLSLL